jgi:hypothetical protein
MSFAVANQGRGTMPRGRKPDLFGSLRAQASKVLSQLEAQIHSLEGEIAHLREHADQWRSAVGGKLRGTVSSGGGKRRGRPPGRPRGPQKGARVKWDEVLASVPKRFGVQDVMNHPGAAAKGRAQVYPVLNRWEATKLIKRVEKGVYEKAGGGATGGVAAPARKRAAAKKK